MFFSIPEISSQKVNQIFNFSGGVGRLLRNIDRQDLNEGRKIDIPDYPTIYDTDIAAKLIVHEMYLNAHDFLPNDPTSIQMFDSWTIPYFISKYRALEIIKKTHPDVSEHRKLAEYEDYSLVIVNDTRVELLVPALLFRVKSEVNLGYSRYVSMALEGILTGWSPNSTETHPSPEHAARGPLLQQICDHSYFQTWSSSAKILYDSSDPAIGTIDLAKSNLRMLQGVENFVGLDGFVFETKDNKLFRMFAAQIKTGRIDASRAICQRELDDWILKAEKGFKKLITLVAPKSAKIEIKEFLLVTTRRFAPNLQISKSLRILNKKVKFTVVEQQRVLNDLADRDLYNRLQTWA
jgi:hypothetical protein